MNGVRIHLGCGGHILQGFLNVDATAPAADAQIDAMEALRGLPTESVEIVYSNAFFEHLERPVQPFLQECLRVLEPDGIALHLGIPNFAEVARCYMEVERGIVDWDGGLFGIENASRYTHGTLDEHDQHHEWMHKDIYDAGKLVRLAESMPVAPFVRVMRYHYPQEPYPLALGLLLSKRHMKKFHLLQLLSDEFIYGVDINTVEFQ